MTIIQISGKAMGTIEGSELSMDPVKYDGGSKGARDIFTALNNAYGRRCGRGWTYEVDTTKEGVKVLYDYCTTVGDTFAGESDPSTRAEGRALLTVAERCTRALAQ